MKINSLKIKFIGLTAVGSALLFTCNKDHSNDSGNVQSIEAINSGNINDRHSDKNVLCGRPVAGDNTDTADGVKKIILKSSPAFLRMGIAGIPLFDEASFQFKPDTSGCADALRESISKLNIDDAKKKDLLAAMEQKKDALNACAVFVPDSSRKLGAFPGVWMTVNDKIGKEAVMQNMLAMTFYALYEYWNDLIFKAALKQTPNADLKNLIDKLDQSRDSIAKAAYDKLNSNDSGKKSLEKLAVYFGVSVDQIPNHIPAKTFFTAEALDSYYCAKSTQDKMTALGYDNLKAAIKSSPLGSELLGKAWFE